jgi:hypothetical protein
MAGTGRRGAAMKPDTAETIREVSHRAAANGAHVLSLVPPPPTH